MTVKVSLKIDSMEVEGISFGEMMHRLAGMKSDLEAKGCEVNITLGDQPIEEVKWIEIPDWYKERYDELQGKALKK